MVQRVGKHAVRHHRVTVIGSRAGPHHVRVIGAVIIAIAGHCFCFVNRASGRHAAIDAPNRFVGRPARLIEFNLNIDAVVLHPLDASDRWTENDPGAGILAGHVENFLCRAHLIGG